MLAPTLYILAFFLTLSLVMGVLVAVHDGIEYLLAQRNNRKGAPAGGGQALGTFGLAAGTKLRQPRQLVVVHTSSQQERPAWFESASRDVVLQGRALKSRGLRATPSQRRSRHERA